MSHIGGMFTEFPIPPILRLFDRLLPRLAPTRGRPGAGRVAFVGAGPGNADLLTVGAARAIGAADVVIHDRLVGDDVLALCPRRARRIAAGKQGYGPSVGQDEINRMITDHARRGRRVVRLKSGDPTVFGRLDEEIDACDAAGVAWRIVPGITAASAGAAAIGQSQTKRGRNASIRFLTGHDMAGFAEHDWRALARPGEVAAIYMGKRSARFIHGAADDARCRPRHAGDVDRERLARRPAHRRGAARRTGRGDGGGRLHRAGADLLRARPAARRHAGAAGPRGEGGSVMSKPFTPKVVTANALEEGDVIYLTADDRWSRSLRKAEVIEDEAHAQLRLLEAQRQPGSVVGAYLADVRIGPHGPEPAHFREAFRARGPSNYPHGKQTEPSDV